MSLYPSLEDMKVDQMYKAQVNHGSQGNSQVPQLALEATNSVALYPALNEFMGLELPSEWNGQNNAVAVPQSHAPVVSGGHTVSNMIAPISGQSQGLIRAQVSHGIREITLCKDANGKVGLRVKAISNGVFVCLVEKGSPAAIVGLRFGDQILSINGDNVAGYSMDQVHSIFRKADVNGIIVVVRDRPFERTVTLHKDSVGKIGFHFKEGRIIGLVQDSSAARNGLLTDHHLLEVDGQNVVGVPDKQITNVIDAAGPVVTVTVCPSFIYEHMVKKMASSLLKNSMDHSIPSI
ncbi:syntenin-1-like [Ischnura elegans]|uniref:syntenin-1-like n=1 Tax=Ischnura elegans TaxID=197161 RepID=UPI001ED89679|nr:syntenin-1-like [Ischnura elegans]XP_046405677.1 syntenin-1-like [Ischnura elegans]